MVSTLLTRFIAKVSNRIKSRLREGDMLGRFSGNKFGVVLMSCGRDDIETAAQRFLSSVSDEVITTEQGPVAANGHDWWCLLARERKICRRGDCNGAGSA